MRTPSDKLAVMGSGPSVRMSKDYDLSKFDVVCLNNAWAAVPFEDIDCWHYSTDFRLLGHRVPSESEWRILDGHTISWRSANLVDGGFFFDTPMERSTVFLDIMSPIMRTACNDRWEEIWFFGCDFDYSGPESHFFGTSTKMNKKTKRLLLENCPEYAHVAADPLRFGKEWMAEHLRKIRQTSSEHGVSLVVPSRKGLLYDCLSG